MQLPKYVKTALNILESGGYEAYVVGGAVRDFLLGKIASDFDIATNAKPQEIISLFSRYHVITKGIKHGTITVFINHKQIEITTFRIEKDYIDYRRPQRVEFIDSLYEDLSRRDFTINALAYNQKIIDYFNGKEDLQNKIIRSVGNPDTIFNEDALRILRALRFACQLQFTIERETSKAIFKNKDLLRKISFERIHVEFDKMLMSNLDLVLIPYFEVFKVFIPELSVKQITKNLQIYKKLPKNRVLLLSSFLYNIENPELILNRLKYSKKIQKQVLLILNHLHLEIKDDLIGLKKLLIDLEVEDLKRIITFKNTLGENLQINFDKLKPFRLKDLAIKGSDLIAIGIPKNEEIARLLRELLILVIEEKISNTKHDLLKYAQNKKNTINK